MSRKEGNQSYFQPTFDIYVGNVNKNIEEVSVTRGYDFNVLYKFLNI